jgi:hypothetical protein
MSKYVRDKGRLRPVEDSSISIEVAAALDSANIVRERISQYLSNFPLEIDRGYFRVADHHEAIAWKLEQQMRRLVVILRRQAELSNFYSAEMWTPDS